MINRLRRDMFYGMPVLHHLKLQSNEVDDLALDTFELLTNLYELNTDDYKFCCIAKQASICTPEADEFSSCEDLLANRALQISIWVLGFLAFTGNLFVMIWRAVKEKFKVSSFFIFNLGASDFLMGVYLIIIASADVHYRGRYIMYARAWRNSSLCTLAGVLATLSSEASVYMLSVITLDRVIALVFPFKFGLLRLGHAKVIVAFGWIIAFVISIVPVFPSDYFKEMFFSRTGKYYKKIFFLLYF